MPKYNTNFYSACNPCPMKQHNCPFLADNITCPEKKELEDAFHALLLLAINARLNTKKDNGYTSFIVNGHTTTPKIFNYINNWVNKNNSNFVATDTNNYKNKGAE